MPGVESLPGEKTAHERHIHPLPRWVCRGFALPLGFLVTESHEPRAL